MNKEALLAHIDAALQSLNHQVHGAVSDTRWLADPAKPVDLAGYGIREEPQAFDFAAWCEAPNPAFGGRTPLQVIDDGTETEREHLADAVDVITALLDGAFS